MRRSITNIFLIGLTVLISGCTQEVQKPLVPQIDKNLTPVDSKKIHTISDINAIALEWSRVDDPNSVGYYIIRANKQKGEKYKRVAEVKSRYATHFVDQDLTPNTKYGYMISVKGNNGKESVGSVAIEAVTLPKMEPISLIESVSDLPRQIKVLWRPHPNPRVEKYQIERTSPTDPKWKKIAVVNNRLSAEYIDKGLGDNEIYFYRVKAITYDNLISYASKITKGNTKPLPGQINSLVASTKLPKMIQLSWGKSLTKDVIKYNIYRANSAQSSYSKIASAPVSHNRFDDMINEDGKIYFYKITTVDKDNLESKLSDALPAMGQTLVKPKPPKITVAMIQDNKVILNWISTDKRAVAYNIYKRTKDGWSSKEKLIPNIQGLRYEDADVVRGIEYGYSIQAIDKHGLLSDKTEESTQKLSKIVTTKEK